MFTKDKNSNNILSAFHTGEKQDGIMTVAEVAEFLRLHRSTISRYAMSGELPSYKIGNRRLFKASDVWQFFENKIVARGDGC